MFNAWQEEEKAMTVQELQRKLTAVTRKLDSWGDNFRPCQAGIEVPSGGA
jgi:hypothetical protein